MIIQFKDTESDSGQSWPRDYMRAADRLHEHGIRFAMHHSSVIFSRMQLHQPGRSLGILDAAGITYSIVEAEREDIA